MNVIGNQQGETAIVFDVGGVLATNLKPALWDELASYTTIPMAELYQQYKKDISNHIWTGQITENQFWQWLEKYGVQLKTNERASLISSHLQPLPAFHRIPIWANTCRLYIMSNHRTEWLNPLLEPVRHFFQGIYISDCAGLSKPQTEWFEQINNVIPEQKIWFVDDAIANLKVAKSVGWNVLLADQDHKWITQLDQWIEL